MSKVPTVNTPRNLNINSGSAWARGPPASSTPSASNSQTASAQAASPVATNPPGNPRTNGQTTHSRRPSAAIASNANQAPPAALKDPVAVSKTAAAPIPAKAVSNVQFGSIDDNNAVLSTSPAPPSAVADIKQVKSFGTISAAKEDATGSTPTISKPVAPPARTDSPAPTGKVKKKIDVSSLFQKTQPSQQPSQSSTPTSTAPPQQLPPVPSAPQDVPARPPPKHQSSYESPSMRNSPLPIMSHPPSQSPSQLHQGTPPFPQFTPTQSHLRHGNGVPGPNNIPRSPSFNRAMTNGTMRGPPGPPGAGGLGSPRTGPIPTPAAAPPPPQNAPPQPPPPSMPGMPPMGVPGPVPHPSHLQAPMPPIPQGQVPPMGMPMWGGYYYQYDPSASVPHYGYWPPPHPQMHPGMPPQPHPPPTPQQQNAHPMQQAGLATPSQTPMAMPMSPRVPPVAPSQPPPQTPSTPHAAMPPAGASHRQSFIGNSKRISIKNSAGEELDISKLRTQKAEDTQTSNAAPKREETERRPVSIRMETEDARKKRLEEEKTKKAKEEEMAKLKAKREAEAKERAKRDQEEKERRKREEEEREKKKQEEEDRVKREAEEKVRLEAERIKREKEEEEERVRQAEAEKERLRAEAEAKEQARLAEEARKKAEAEEAKKKAEEEARIKAQQEEEARKKAEEERLKKEAEEKARQEEEKARQEEEARLKEKARQEEEARKLKEKEEQEAAAAAVSVSSVPADLASRVSTPLGSTPAQASPATSAAALPKSALPPGLDPKAKGPRPIPGRLDLSSTNSSNVSQPLPSALASARIIDDIGKVSYPEGIKAPSSELNLNAKSGKFKYDRDFLMQFMKVCKEKPDDMPSLDAIGLEPSDQGSGFSGRRNRAPMPPNSARGQAGLGISGPGGVPFSGKSFGGGGMGNFQAPAGRSSEERFAASLPRGTANAIQFPRQTLGRTNSTSGPNLPGPGRGRDTPQRTNSNRGSKRVDSKAAPPAQLAGAHSTLATLDPELHTADNAWSAQRKPAGLDPNSPEYVDRKVKALLNKLTLEKFDSISHQILEWANRSVNETDGHTLIQVIRLVFEKATDEATWSEMYARLCRFLMERISQDVRDEGIKNAEGKPIAGGQLFRKYLLNRCQEDFERGWSAQEAAKAAAASKAEDDKAVAAAAEKSGNQEEALYSDEYYAVQKAKRRGLGLVKFIGELFKKEMLTERIMHECIKKLLSNVENPEEEEIESLCKLLATVGQSLDTSKAKNHMDIYFSRMQELASSGQITSRMQFMLLDIIELRSRKWVTRTQVAAPTTIAEVHQKAERDRQVAEREAALRQAGGRDYNRNNRRDGREYSAGQPGADGWTTPSRAPPKPVDLSNFGKISKPTTMQFGPSSVFSKKDKRESTSSTRGSSSSNMFAALNSSEPTPDTISMGSRTANSTRPPSRKASIDMSVSSLADGIPQRRKLQLQPRTHALASETGSVRDDGGSALAPSEVGEDETASNAASTTAASAAALTTISAEQAKRKVKEDVKEFLSLKSLAEGEGYFMSLPPEFRWHLVQELVHKAIDAKASDVQLVCELFGMAASKSLIDEAQFARGFEADMEYLEDTSTDSPNAYGNMASLLKAAKLSQGTVESLGDKIFVEGDMAIKPKDKLLKKYAALTT